MKILFVLGLVALSYAQVQNIFVLDATSESELPPISKLSAGPNTCFAGEERNGVVTSFSVVNCSFSDNSTCQTKIELNNGNVIINRQCKQAEACENNKKNNIQQCYSEDAIAKNVRVCFHCCAQAQCNNFKDIPKQNGDEEVNVV